VAAGAALGASAVFAASAQAAPYTVTNTNPSGSGSLAAAISSANGDPSGQDDTINFQAGLTGTITVTSPLAISGPENLTIAGPGAGTLKVSGGGTSGVFAITAPENANEAIAGLTITDGSAAEGGAIAATAAVSNSASATLALANDTITNSKATTNTGDDGGGAVFAEGDLTVIGSTISGNTSAEVGGGIDIRKYEIEDDAPALTVSNSTITGNTALDGGGLYTEGYGTVSGTQITGNHATSASTSGGEGGGIDVDESLNLTNSTVSGNTSTNDGGGIEVEGDKYVTISGSTLSGNTSTAGGGINLDEDSDKYAPIRIDSSTISANKATDGAGVYISRIESNAVTISASTISGNQGQGTSSIGGGVEIYEDVYGNFEVVDSTISGNTATIGAGVSLGADPSTDDALNGASGTGTPGSIAFRNSTIAGNAATEDGGGIYLSAYKTGSPSVLKSGTAAITSTIISGNTAAGAAQDLARTAGSTSGGFDGAFDLFQTVGTAPFLSEQSVITGVSPQLGPLQNNGGPTQTMLPAPTSPVIDGGHAAETLSTDQRGDPRTVDVAGIPRPPGGDGTDIGAVELPASSVPTVLAATLRGTLLSSAVSPLLPGTASPIDCTVRIGTLNSCVIHIVSGGKLLADGDAQSPTGAATLAVPVTPTAAGLKAIAKSPLGITAPATISTGGNGGAQSTTGDVQLLAGRLFTLPTGKTDTKTPSKAVKSELKQVATLLQGAGAKSVTCTAYTKKGPHKGKKDKSDTTALAKNVCGYVLLDGFKGKSKVAGKGHTIAANQVVISFSF
jgi:hypothetical protein